MPSSQEVGAVIIGAGPYGLAAAAHLKEKGVEHRSFGTPMSGWFDHMPIGMFLKSTARDSSIGSPDTKTGIGAWCAAAGVEPYDRNGGETPIPVTDFIEYGRWFQEREVPTLEQEQVTGVARSVSGFEVELASGEHRVNGHQRGHHVRLAATERRETEFGQASLQNVLVVSTQR